MEMGCSCCPCLLRRESLHGSTSNTCYLPIFGIHILYSMPNSLYIHIPCADLIKSDTTTDCVLSDLGVGSGSECWMDPANVELA